MQDDEYYDMEIPDEDLEGGDTMSSVEHRGNEWWDDESNCYSRYPDHVHDTNNPLLAMSNEDTKFLKAYQMWHENKAV